MVGLDDIARVAHAMEDVIEQLSSRGRVANPELIDTLLAASDGLLTMIPAAIEGRDTAGEADVLVQLLHALAIGFTSAAPGAAVDQQPAVDVVAPSERPSPARHHRDAEAILVPVRRLDELVRLVGESAAAHLRIGRMLSERLALDSGTITEFRHLSLVLTELQERTMRARMVPVATITDSLQRAVRDLARTLGKSVRWEVRGGDTELDRSMLQQLADPLLHLVRNAVDHGIESPAERSAAGKQAEASLVLHAMQVGPEVIITVSDDGRGIDVDRVRAKAARRGADVAVMNDEESLYLIFGTGLSTAASVTDVSGRGVGLDVVRTSVDAVRGRIEVVTARGEGSEFRIIVPITLAVLPCLLVQAGAERYAIPMHSVVQVQSAAPGLESHAAGRPMVWVNDTAVAASSLTETLGVAAGAAPDSQVVVVTGLVRKHAFGVTALLGQRDVVVKGLGRLLPRLDVLAGASVEPDGSILLVLDVNELIRRAREGGAAPPSAVLGPADEAATPGRRGAILVVDDAMTIRELQRSILERAGFGVVTASDGLEALARLGERAFDLVLTDVEMPRMDGLALTEAIRRGARSANLPVILLTSRSSDEDRRRGLEAGADAYIVKSAFDEPALLSAVERFLGGSP